MEHTVRETLLPSAISQELLRFTFKKTCAERRYKKRWSGKRGSNSRPPPWQGGALPLSYFRILTVLSINGYYSNKRQVFCQEIILVAVIVWAAHPFAQFFPQNNLKAAPLSLTASQPCRMCCTINIHPHSGWFFIFGHSPYVIGGVQVRLLLACQPCTDYLPPINGSLGSNKLS